ncbi:GMP synthase [Candidatus Micrarchaeota archaeon CG_4_10_14_0_2_um_filter_60_11]|nr:MAG: hypothetical protein AUJ16_01070 [Candidatus Micrarchaeota archaeon CG1_02_60_51]PIN96194.1 MAG: GMP synthase [Candidatus Micrarchaeota archaeon CG10_big_fil_rev_8_21_14_0_10_60_32]PIO01635.1 MAG: GMP synthase [Candidatus Micrarchaeota archaeon CG09_land_8_20_14_0_10_60_16]PIY91482.1 MAG: GMP synthase [Candidatus Micrarchaeota archaeon CG_4_10_14_0_8_um_filter_60_7]PIZ90623.1 MAG: GMP synthase [Candidatus Micrarchaeota archaeon CG_4_10_14_0_2_um_filter_60_11]
MKIPVVQNGSQWEHRIWRVLRDLGAESRLVPNATPFSELADSDGIVLSGGALRIGEGAPAGNCAEYLDRLECPILGICAGQQFIAAHYGGLVKPAKVPEFGRVDLIVREPDGLFDGLPERFTVWASHNDEVVEAKGFRLLASSKDCEWHAFRHERLPRYGTLFHPEVQHTEHGEKIYGNFVKLCKQ